MRKSKNELDAGKSINFNYYLLILIIFQDVYPFRISGVLIINTPPFIDAILNKMVIPFLKKKLRERVSKYHFISTIYFVLLLRKKPIAFIKVDTK